MMDLVRHCLDRRIASSAQLAQETVAWEQACSVQQMMIIWMFTTQARALDFPTPLPTHMKN
jgi:hypothetical protein